MVTIYMNNQNKTNQIIDWRICNKYENNKLMLTVDFSSGKKWTMPLIECPIEPYRELGEDFTEVHFFKKGLTRHSTSGFFGREFNNELITIFQSVRPQLIDLYQKLDQDDYYDWFEK